jgi:CBS domain-containing protein
MLSLRDLMTPEVLTLDPDMTLREAVERLVSEGISGAPVVVGGRLVGVVSSTDILEFESTNPGVPSFRSEQQDLGEWGPAAPWEEDVSDPPAAWFREMWGDSGADVAERMADPETPEWDFLAEHVVGEVMTRKVVALGPDAPLAEAAGVMVASGIHRLLVTEDDVLVGIVSAMDFVRAVAEGKLP